MTISTSSSSSFPSTKCDSSRESLWRPDASQDRFSISADQVDPWNHSLYRVVKSWQEYQPQSGQEFPIGSSRYRIINEIGRGCSKTVWLAVCVERDDYANETLPSKVALVFWKLFGDADMGKVDREEEALSWVQEIPGTLKVIESPKRIGQQVVRMATNYCDGGTLNAWAEGKPVIIRLQTLLQVARSLEKAHAEGIAHGDVKSANIGIEGLSCPVILDWGSSTKDGRNRELEVDTTPAYAPPYGNVRRNNSPIECDVFSLGAILFEMMGSSPQEGALAVEVAKRTGKNRNQIAYRFSTTQEEIDLAVGRIPDPMKELLTLMSRIDPQTRITMPEVVARLQTVIDTMPTDFYGIPDLGCGLEREMFSTSSDRY